MAGFTKKTTPVTSVLTKVDDDKKSQIIDCQKT